MARIVSPVFAFNDSSHVRLYFEDEEEKEIMEERRQHLTEEEIDAIVSRAVKKALDEAMERLYADIGKGIVKKLLWGVVLSVLGFALGKHLIS